jgi:hypothetical protein
MEKELGELKPLYEEYLGIDLSNEELIKNRIEEVEKEIEESRKRRGIVEKELLKFKNIREELEDLRKEENALLTFLATIKTRVEEAEKRIKEKEGDLEKLREDVEDLRKKAKRANKMSYAKGWLDTKFIPAMESIEKNVMTYINAEFEKLFREWFNILLEGVK